jgi:hypothetical protein
MGRRPKYLNAEEKRQRNIQHYKKIRADGEKYEQKKRMNREYQSKKREREKQQR